LYEKKGRALVPKMLTGSAQDLHEDSPSAPNVDESPPTYFDLAKIDAVWQRGRKRGGNASSHYHARKRMFDRVARLGIVKRGEKKGGLPIGVWWERGKKKVHQVVYHWSSCVTGGRLSLGEGRAARKMRRSMNGTRSF